MFDNLPTDTAVDDVRASKGDAQWFGASSAPTAVRPSQLADGRILAAPSRPAAGLRSMSTGNALTATRFFRVLRRPEAIIVAVVIALSLTSCSATNNNAFLGAPYDGPTAAWGYNLP